MNEFEIQILDFIRNTFSCKFLDVFFAAITALSNKGVFWIILAVVLLFFKKTRKTGICLCVALTLGLVLGNIFLKNVIARPRPYTVNPNVDLIIDKLSDYSFPSGHTTCSCECALVIFANNKKWGIAAIILAFLTILSRLYLYVHYPTDVLGGLVLGVFDGIIAMIIVNKIYDIIKKRKSIKK